MASRAAIAIAFVLICFSAQAASRPDDCACPRTLSEVCGSDGKSYGNECMATCNGATVKALGRCHPPCNCPRVLAPVCAGGKQYANECQAKCQVGAGADSGNQQLGIKAGPC